MTKHTEESRSSSLRTFLREIIDETRDKVTENIARIIITGIIATLILVSSYILIFFSDLQNISREEALAAAKVTVGANTLDAIPFRNKDTDKQYIAVTTFEKQEFTVYPALADVILLEGTAQIYQVRDTGMQAIVTSDEPTYKGKRFADIEIVDINNDGNKEVFARAGNFGSSGYTLELQLYDSLTRETHFLTYGGEYGDVPKISDSSSSSSSTVTGWLLRQMEKVQFFDPSDEAVIWEQNNGKGFHEGSMEIYEVQGEIDPRGSVNCEIDDGDYKWISLFKGPVYAYDISRDVHFIVYVPWWVYGHVRSMISGEEYLWMGVAREDGLLVYHKSSRSLEIMPFPELEQLLANSGVEGVPDNVGTLQIRDETLYFDGEFGNLIRLSLPNKINFRQEFGNAVSCQ